MGDISWIWLSGSRLLPHLSPPLTPLFLRGVNTPQLASPPCHVCVITETVNLQSVWIIPFHSSQAPFLFCRLNILLRIYLFHSITHHLIFISLDDVMFLLSSSPLANAHIHWMIPLPFDSSSHFQDSDSLLPLSNPLGRSCSVDEKHSAIMGLKELMVH